MVRSVHCIHCSSDDVEFKADILVGCCEHKSGELWHCNRCGEDMTMQVVFTDEQEDLHCPHEHGEGDHQCGSCDGCGGKH